MKSKTADTDGTIIEFLNGSHSYEGVWFGDKHRTKEGTYWWRKILRDYVESSQLQPPVPDEAPKEWEEQATKDYENGYESETSAIDKFVFADEAGEVYVWVKASEILPKERVCVRYTVDGKMKYFDSDDWYTLDGLDVEWLCKYTPAPPSGEDAGKGWISENVDFDSPEMKLEIEKVKKEIKAVMDGAKIDTSKLHITFG